MEDYFMQYGDVQNVRLVKDMETGRSRGFAFITFSNEAEAQRATSLGDGEDLDGRSMRVNIS